MPTIQEVLTYAYELQKSGNVQDAEHIYRQVIEQEPENSEAMHLLGLLAHQVGNHAAALELMLQSIKLDPNRGHFHSNLGEVYRSLGRMDEAIAACQLALELEPDFVEGYNNLGNAYIESNRIPLAIENYRKAIILRPSFVDAYNNLGNALKIDGKHNEAMAAYRQAISIDPNFSKAYNNLAGTLKDQGEIVETINCYRRSVELDPTSAPTYSNYLYTLTFGPGYDSKYIHNEHCAWYRHLAEPLAPTIQPHTNDRSPNRKLRIGYVSPDLRDHVVGRNMIPLFREHDHNEFDIYVYSMVVHEDPITAFFRSRTEGWRVIYGHQDADVAQQIRDDKIDILVDLTLHMANNRLLLFARKPAPIQVTFAGYPGTTGLPTIDYRFTDPYLDPPGLFDEFNVEKAYRLPHSFWCYDPLERDLQVQELPALKNGYITFGCCNNFCKVTDNVLRLWSKVMRAVPNSRLLLLTPAGSTRERIWKLMEREKIERERISFFALERREQYLLRYNGIDIGLDTFPYNGHTTSLDSYWMGVPVVTLVGNTVVGRAGYCHMQNLKMPEWIAETPDQFVKLAADFASDIPRLSQIRASMRERMEKSPLMDAISFTRGIEAAYRDMWRQYCNS